jgi:peptidoglycan L-alanyl-D-glutamate endopeptidase CwlK
MGINRNINALKPKLAKRATIFCEEMKKQGIDYFVVETLRTQDIQNAYYAQGRKPLDAVNELRKNAGLYLLTENENKNTVTQTLKSNHADGNAIDIAPMKDGKIWWNAPQDVWERMGKIGEACGLDWCAGGEGKAWHWDNPHYELPNI